MRHLSNLPIARKTSGLFIVNLGLLGLVCVLALHSLWSIKADFETYQGSSKVVESIGRIEADLLASQIAVNRFLVHARSDDRDAALASSRNILTMLSAANAAEDSAGAAGGMVEIAGKFTRFKVSLPATEEARPEKVPLADAVFDCVPAGFAVPRSLK